MNNFDFKKLVDTSSIELASKQVKELRVPNTSWMNQDAYLSNFDNFYIHEGQYRYTVNYENVPFECLYLPSSTDKLYVCLSGGGTTTHRKYPSFLRWKYQAFLDGHVLCIDDPMYHLHPEMTLVMWYYGTKDKPYLQLLLNIVKKVMSQLSINANNVTFIGSSGGGYSALYCANMLDYSSAIAMNPQIVLKDWQAPTLEQYFQKWGIDLASNDKFGRNRLQLTNKTSKFFITVNAASKKEYELQFIPFFEMHGIIPSYGFSQKDNIALWIHTTDFKIPHVVIPYRVGVVFLNYLLEQMKRGVNINDFANLGILANEILYEKYDAMEKSDKVSDEKKCVYKFFTYNISQIVRESLYRRIPLHISSRLRTFLHHNYEIENVEFQNGNIGFFIGDQKVFRYNIIYHNENMYFRLKFGDFTSHFKQQEELKIFLNEFKTKVFTNWYIDIQNTLVVSVILVPEKMEKQICDLIDFTLDIVEHYLEM